jgi:hypothetical protein
VKLALCLPRFSSWKAVGGYVLGPIDATNSSVENAGDINEEEPEKLFM